MSVAHGPGHPRGRHVMDTPLLRPVRMRTTDPEEAQRRVAEVYCAHDLGILPGPGRLDVVHDTGWIGEIGVHHLRYGEEVRITPDLLVGFYLVQVPLRGRARVVADEEVVASDRHRGTLLSPTQSVDMVWSADCEQLLVYLPRAMVESAAHPPLDDGSRAPVEFSPRVELDSPGIRGWLRLVQLVADELELGDGLLTSSLAAESLQQALAHGLLAAQPNDSAVEPVESGRLVPSLAVRATRELIEAHPEHPWTLADLAGHAGCSPRTLQVAFRRERGTTPMGALRRVRMARAHADLLAGDPLTTRVSEVAGRWGFFHLGRFAAAHRATYGMTPSEAASR